MKLWMSAETQSNVADDLRVLRNEIVDKINQEIINKDYDIGVSGWDVIIILQSDGGLGERTKYNKKKREMDFRLRLNFDEYAKAERSERLRMIFFLIEKSLDILKILGGNADEIDKLVADVEKVGVMNSWLPSNEE